MYELCERGCESNIKLTSLSSASPQTSPPSVPPQEVKEQTCVDDSVASDGRFYSDQSPPSACSQPPCGDIAATESEQDLDVLCQTNTPM